MWRGLGKVFKRAFAVLAAAWWLVVGVGCVWLVGSVVFCLGVDRTEAHCTPERFRVLMSSQDVDRAWRVDRREVFIRRKPAWWFTDQACVLEFREEHGHTTLCATRSSGARLCARVDASPSDF